MAKSENCSETNSSVTDAALVCRQAISAAQLIVVKVGSSSLTTSDGQINVPVFDALCAVIAERIAAGRQVVLVSSGAIAAGIGHLGLQERPTELPLAQAAASVGQGLLMAEYEQRFASYQQTIGQVLLTSEDVTRRSTYINARATLQALLDHHILPVINENDTVATQEIRFGDNDRLAALVAHLLNADALLLLSDVDGLYDRPPHLSGAQREDFVVDVRSYSGDIGGVGSSVGTGGMHTKIEAATIASGAGIPTLLASAQQVREALIFSGGFPQVGTVFAPTGKRDAARRLWLAHATTPVGQLVLDAGAVYALLHDGRSLLPAGVTACVGVFHAGDVVELRDQQGQPIARGLVRFDSRDIPPMLGKSSADIKQQFGPEYVGALVHRDHLVSL